MKARSLIFIVVGVIIKSIILLEGHDHRVVIIGFMDEVDFAEDENFTVDGVAVVVEFHVDFVVGKNTRAVDCFAVYGFGEFGENSVFVEHIGGSVEATILREDWFLLWLVQSRCSERRGWIPIGSDRNALEEQEEVVWR